MSLISQGTWFGRLAIAPFKGFFKAPWKSVRTSPRPPAPTVWAHIRQVARDDFILFWEPYIYAVRKFHKELNRN